jgi:hypothetical protein
MADPAEPPARSAYRDEVLEVRPLTGVPFAAFEAVNRSRGSRYPVYLPAAPSLEGAMCTCEDFARRGRGVCKHIEAVAVYLRDAPPPAAPDRTIERQRAADTWGAIDEGFAALPTGPAPTARQLRAIGRALLTSPLE